MDDVDTSKAVTQSDSAVAGTAPLASVAPPAPITPPELTTLKCPSCEATLQKVSITPGVKINCLHCGAKFFPPNATGATDDGESAVGELAAPAVREPKSPGYWLLRIPAAIALFAGLFITALIAWDQRHLHGADRLDFWWGASYVPLIALAGTFAFLWSRSLARIDVGWTHRFWKKGLLREPLPPMPGSSLPYIAPLAVVGGFYPVFCFAFGHTVVDEGGPVLIGGLFGGLLFLLGFMAEDIRQFAWRERATAEKIAPPTELDRHRPYGSKVYAYTGIACAAGFGGLALLTAYSACDYWQRNIGYRYESWALNQTRMMICMSLAFAACAITGFLLCRDWDRAVASWLRVAAKSSRQSGNPHFYAHDPPARGLSALAGGLPVGWAIYGIIWLIASACANSYESFREPGRWLLLATPSCLGATAWFSRLIVQVSRWRQAKQTACATLLKEKTPAENPRVPGWPGMIVRLTLLLLLCEAALMSILLIKECFSYRNRWEEFFAIPLILGIVHYPTLWIATLVSEFLAMENSATAQKPLDE